MWADYNAPNLLTDAQAAFLASHYAFVSLEKCTGIADNLTTEAAVLRTAAQLKAHNPALKVLMYWPMNLQGVVKCYAAGATLFQDHPQFLLRDDYNNLVRAGPPGSDEYYLDWTRQDVRDWFTAVPLAGANASALLDGTCQNKRKQTTHGGLADL